MTRFILLVLVAAFYAFAESTNAEDTDPAAVFEQRIMPIFRSPNPSSCLQCHLSSVDLKDYIRPSSRETFLSLRDQGLINLEEPEDSKILHLIAMGESDPDSLAKRIHAKNRKIEYDSFTAWVKSCCKDLSLVSAESPQNTFAVGPSKSNRIIRHTRKDRVLDSFVRNIWSQRMRCFPCHTPSEIDEENPLHDKPRQRYQDFVAQYGARMAIFKENPEKTLEALETNSRKQSGVRLPLINLANPSESLLLLKPTAKLPQKNGDGKPGKPSSSVPVSHMGGIKMHKDDHSYKAFVAWLSDYADSVSGTYSDPMSLPDDNWFPTEHVIRIKGLPDDWPVLSTVQVFVHRWDSKRSSWSDAPIAFTQCKLTPRRFVNGSLFVLAGENERDSLNPEQETLEPGKVQLRIYLDHAQKIRGDPTHLLNGQSPDAQAVLEAKFGQGFKDADVIEQVQRFHRAAD
tara:strand:+ start:257165 stop:258535 length:1371 start_codon:yes stop_codon:yes gene_type:complete